MSTDDTMCDNRSPSKWEKDAEEKNKSFLNLTCIAHISNIRLGVLRERSHRCMDFCARKTKFADTWIPTVYPGKKPMRTTAYARSTYSNYLL